MQELRIPTARDVMTSRVVTLRSEMRVIDAMRDLIRHKISGAPVLDDDGNVVGLVSEFDCLRVVASGLYTAFDEGRDLTENDLANAIQETVPLYETYEERIKELRDWARHRARPATLDGRMLGLFEPR